jgi:septum formation protein
VIGSDQVLVYRDRLVDKAGSRTEALAKLKMLQGSVHSLISAVCVAEGNRIVWEYVDKVDLTMRALNDNQLAAYADAAGPALTECVGAYALEGAGAWLFEKIEGDYFTVLGMPLLPLLGYLRTRGSGHD